MIQPNFFAQGLTDLELTFDLTTKTVADIKYSTLATTQINTFDEALQTQIDFLMGKYAPMPILKSLFQRITRLPHR